MQVAFRNLMRERHRWLTQVLAAAQRRGAVKSELPAADLAMLLAASLQGAVQLARAHGRSEHLEVVVARLRHLLGMPTAASN